MSNLNLTPQQLAEFFKCQFSPIYFAKTFAWIMQSETSEVIPFNPLSYRLKILKKLYKGKNLLGKKSRRVGWSWTVALFVAWLINFRPGVRVLFLSKNEDDAKDLLAKVRFILRNLAYHDAKEFEDATLAPWLLNHIETDNQTTLSIGFHNDEGKVTKVSTVESLTTTGQSGRSRGATLIFIDEFGFIKPDDEKTWTAIKPTVARGGQWVACSTCNGVGGVFHRLCMQAERGDNKKFDYMVTHWTETEITPEQYEEAIEGMDEQSIAQEWEMDFAQSGDPAFNATHLAACYKPPDEYPEIKEFIEEYHRKVGEYYLGVDSALGKAHRASNLKDYNSLTALSNNGIQCFTENNKASLAKWAGYTQDDTEIPGMVSLLHAKYPGTMYIEENGPGSTVINRHKVPTDAISQIVPIPMTQKTKSRIINNLAIAVESHQIIITDLFTYQCMLVYQRGDQPGTWNAPKGYNDDPVMALALAWDALVREQNYVIDLGLPNNPKRAIKSPEEIELINIENAANGPVLLNHPNLIPVDVFSDNSLSNSGHFDLFSNQIDRLDINLMPDMNLMRELQSLNDETSFNDELSTPRMRQRTKIRP